MPRQCYPFRGESVVLAPPVPPRVRVAPVAACERAQWLRLGVACDPADAVAGLAAGRRGELPKAATFMVTTTALVAAALGIAALQDNTPAV